MPRKNTYKSSKVKTNKYPKRSYRRRQAYLPPLKNMAIMGTGLPRKVMVKHKYVHSFTEAIPANILGSYAFKANGMQAPTTITGVHQPMYFDQYGALYNHFCVIGSKATFRVVHVTAPTADSAFRMCAFIDGNNALLATNIDAVSEATSGRTITVVPSSASVQTVKTLKWSGKKTFGKAVLGNKALTGDITADPTEISNFVLAIQGYPGQNTDVAITVEIEYIAIWTELKEVSQS